MQRISKTHPDVLEELKEKIIHHFDELEPLQCTLPTLVGVFPTERDIYGLYGGAIPHLILKVIVRSDRVGGARQVIRDISLLFDLLKDLFTLAGMKDTFPKSLADARGGWDSMKCLTKSKIKGIKKPEMDDFTEKVCHLLMERCYPVLDRLSNELEETERRLLDSQEELIVVQRKLVESQDTLVKLQCQLLEKRDKEITAVQSTAEKEIKSFSSVLQKGCDKALAPQRVRQAIVVATEDRSSNVIVHGLTDDPTENDLDLEHDVKGVFSYMGSCITGICSMKRLGKYKEGSNRPVKLRLCGKDFRDQVLSSKKSLKNSDRHKDVYISPDRSPEEREERRKLVVTLKERKVAEPGKAFGIRGGKVEENGNIDIESCLYWHTSPLFGLSPLTYDSTILLQAETNQNS
eukprot:sb/3465279/